MIPRRARRLSCIAESGDRRLPVAAGARRAESIDHRLYPAGAGVLQLKDRARAGTAAVGRAVQNAIFIYDKIALRLGTVGAARLGAEAVKDFVFPASVLLVRQLEGYALTIGAAARR